MRLPREVVALVYRELVWFKRFIGEYLFMWLLPFFFVFAIIGLPASISGLDPTISRFSRVLGVEVSLLDVVIAMIALSSVVNVVAGVVADILQILYFEFRSEETVSTVLVTVGIRRYILATAFTRPLFITVLSTLYVLVSFTLLQGFSGVLLYVILLPILVVSAIVMGLFSTPVAVFMYYYGGVRRPWIVTNLLVPAVISGAGIFVPVELVPWYLRLVSQVTPIPQVAEAIRLVTVIRSFEVFRELAVVVTVFYAIYCTLVLFTARVSDIKIRQGGWR